MKYSLWSIIILIILVILMGYVIRDIILYGPLDFSITWHLILGICFLASFLAQVKQKSLVFAMISLSGVLLMVASLIKKVGLF